ncbi:tryptophan 2,3-dioxygenase-like isoform X3 [Gigantopelta aegis]|nr:tryptophan 2,3-dioxygenase-like isoform X3 [Gigantopelta aegis]XP_041359496.1 tryptophan 2,3-dioxygenase-like isoform X3 [Gigantopelta aegis]
MSEKKENEDLHYDTYLRLDSFLECQIPQSLKLGGQLVHDEHLFITTHQAFELWFKQILVEIDSVREMFHHEFEVVESKMLYIVRRLGRVAAIFKLIIEQFHILETMTPIDYMDFRYYLKPASGFQSLQFRCLENKLGVVEDLRRYKDAYKDEFIDEKSKTILAESINSPSLADLVEKWLENIPVLNDHGFDILQSYKNAFLKWTKDTILDPAMNERDAKRKEKMMTEYNKQADIIDVMFEDVDKKTEHRRMSSKALTGALMISLYREEPRFNQPFQMLTLLKEVDSLMAKWRDTHVSMVHRMIGQKPGVGYCSSGYLYLRSTCSDNYAIFPDLINMPTYLMPRVYYPQLPETLKQKLAFAHNSQT